MEAKELMVGDWVRIDEPDKYAGATGQIQSLMYHREGDAAYFNVFIQGKFGYVSRDVCSDDIRPITLTAEILEENGFTRLGTGYILKGEHFGLDNPSNPSNYLDNYWLRISIKAVHIEYVHQLQHTLGLCGIEKEIVL